MGRRLRLRRVAAAAHAAAAPLNRVGHGRPVGSTARNFRLHSWHEATDPELGDLVWEKPVEVKRGYRVVGVAETSDPTRWRLDLERLDWTDFLVRSAETERVWSFIRDRR